MMSLSDYHQAFVGYFGTGDSGAVTPYLETPEQADRLKVYLNTYAVGAVDTLERHFPALLHLMGNMPFREVARAYVAEHPPQHRSLSVYGDRFTEFINQNIRDEAGQQTFCSDLVRLDSAWTEVYFASNETSVGAEHLGELQNRLEEQRFTLSDTAKRVETQWQVLSFWAELRDGAPDGSVHVETGGESILLFRKDTHMRYQPLSDAENAFVVALESGSTLIAAGERASRVGVLDVADTIAQFFTHRILKTGE